MLEKARPCVLCELDLRPAPEKMFPWVEKYRKEKIELAKKSVLSWDILPADLKKVFSSYSYETSKWTALPVTKREETFVKLIEDEYSRIMPKDGEKFDHKNIESAWEIYPYLSKEKRESLKKAIENAVSAVSSSTGAALAQIKTMTAVKDELSSNPEDSFMILGKAFDNFSQSGNFTERPFDNPPSATNTAGSLSKEEEKISPLLQKSIFKEIETTDIGKNAIAFSKTEYGKLNFIVRDLKSLTTRGMFSPGSV